MPPAGRHPLDLAVVGLALFFPTAAAWFYFMAPAGLSSLPLAYSASKVIQFGFPVAWVFLLRRRSGTWAGLHEVRAPGPLPGRLLQGVLWGLLMLALILGTYAALQGGSLLSGAAVRISERSVAMGAATPARYLLLTLGISVIHAGLEEYYWRWFIFGGLRARFTLPVALVVSSLGFAGHHVIVLRAFFGPGEWPATILLSLGVVAGGGVWAWLWERTGGLPAPWLSHILVDLTLMGIGYHLIFS